MGTEKRIESLVRELASGDPSRRAAAAKGLGRIGRPEHAAVLAAAARDEDAGVRAAAAIGLGRLAAPAAGDVLFELLDDPDAQVRRRAVLAADRLALDGPAFTAALGRLLRDEEYHVRLNALAALDRLREPGDLPSLVELLDDPVQKVREWAGVLIRVLHYRGGHADALAPLLARTARSGPGRARAVAMTLIPEDERPGVAVAGLTAAEPEVRVAAVGLLSRSGRPDVPERLLAALDAERDPVAAGVLIGALGWIGERRVVAGAVRWLYDPHAGFTAAWALGVVGTPDALRRLRTLVAPGSAPPPGVRGSAATALGAAGDRRDAAALAALLVEPDSDVRRGALQGLASLDIVGPRSRRERAVVLEAVLGLWEAELMSDRLLPMYAAMALRGYPELRRPDVRARLRRLVDESLDASRSAAAELLEGTG
ncbi:HEAT repeat domain-containing protein [Actinomadura rugatobispora]|uniref:HEAT repeat domain-containing protein n=1 Tax=Actinomadura rugatobispora TaxID=1994 RepID=A0ABW0ZV16_9ACTN|nr:hypothetical protein GCM10010200_027220 [Actinomadura rugatobispora]